MGIIKEVLGDGSTMIQETNFMELVLRQMMIGLTVYDDYGKAMVIDELNYQPLTKTVIIKTPENEVAYFHMEKNFDFDFSQIEKLIPNKTKVIGKRSR